MLVFYLIKESFLYAIHSLVVNKLRTFLSLLGITIGIFAIISVFTVIDSLENSIRKSIASLGESVVYVQKWPWSFGSEYPWWKYMSRPLPQIKEMDEIIKRSQKVKAATFMIFLKKTIQFGSDYAENIQVTATAHEYENIKTFEIANGRYFSFYESKSGSSRIILGANIAEQLFPSLDPVGKEVKMGGYKMLVVGVFKKEGSDFFGMSTDDQVIIPINFARNIVNLRDESLGPMIMVKAKDKVGVEELTEELRGIMRSIRRLRPLEEDNFALNKTSLLSQGFDGLFKVIDLAGLVIGGFSILVGGFGIANIMFVSVKEQTQQIGIQKAIGAKSYFILLQFLYEATILSLIGGLVGLLIIFLLTKILSLVGSMDFSMSMWNISLGLIISISIGIISGFVPAYKAAKLNPVEAINSNG